MSEVVINELKGHDARISPENAEKHIRKIGGDGSDFIQFIDEAEKIPSSKLEPEIRTRVITFLKGFSKDASTDQIKASFVSVRNKIFGKFTLKLRHSFITYLFDFRTIYMAPPNQTQTSNNHK